MIGITSVFVCVCPCVRREKHDKEATQQCICLFDSYSYMASLSYIHYEKRARFSARVVCFPSMQPLLRKLKSSCAHSGIQIQNTKRPLSANEYFSVRVKHADLLEQCSSLHSPSKHYVAFPVATSGTGKKCRFWKMDFLHQTLQKYNA